ncbi:MAG: SGNH/GDSL hydrolase family protein [Burkholderiales bacterium]|nr:SGNH/GDSL hydrolase family protein [Burkholderiales bacterium]
MPEATADNVIWGTQGALAQNRAPSIMMIGDSWFWYPFSNLAREVGTLRPHQTVLVVGRNGAEAAEWATKFRKDIDFAFQMYGASVKTLILSGGGNDVAGMNDFMRLIKDDCASQDSVEGCYRTAEPEAIMSMIMGCYKALITKFRAYNGSAPVILHQYDYAWPTGKGVFGPADWLNAPMSKAGVKEGLRAALFRSLIDRLKAAQLELAREPAMGKILVANSAGSLPAETAVWANELHPTPAGFKLIAQKAIDPELKRVPI